MKAVTQELIFMSLRGFGWLINRPRTICLLTGDGFHSRPMGKNREDGLDGSYYRAISRSVQIVCGNLCSYIITIRSCTQVTFDEQSPESISIKWFPLCEVKFVSFVNDHAFLKVSLSKYE